MARAIIVLILAALPSPAISDGIAQLVHYRSPVDDSQQAYGVYVPEGAPPESGYPVVLHGHGYGWSVSNRFSQWQKDWADAHRWILVQLNARGPNFYWGIGDVATREVVEDLHLRFGIDRKRVYITGGSMGGTGAFRQGVVNPEMIAAAVGVDGWADFREWHWHWYARKDQRDDIEEFRRPLLEAASPLYMAERARWGDVHVIADGRDTVVYPQQGIDLAQRLLGMGVFDAGAYDSGLTLNPTKGHGGGYNLTWIYNYFLGKSARPERGSFRIATTVLEHGEMYWARMERLHFQGEKAVLECSAEACPTLRLRSGQAGVSGLGTACPTRLSGLRTAGPTLRLRSGQAGVSGLRTTCPTRVSGLRTAGIVDVITTNLDALTLHLPLSPVADLERVRIYVDGIPAYEGPPGELTFEVVRDAGDELVGWVVVEPSPPKRHRVGQASRLSGKASRNVTGETPVLREKSREIGGPIGHAFVSPFKVCYGTVGPEEAQRRNREEAIAFCNGWNGFMVHAKALEAAPEQDIADWDIQRHNLVVYGTLDTSRLLQRAHALRPLPVEVYADGVLVRDPLSGDREYRGEKFGVFFAYPNPLTEGRTYLVICNGRYASSADGKNLQGLEFDLEKLSWGYPDYVIFNCDRRDLPHVMNVNNKPPVTCYEPGYFVEAGYFDADWRPDRFVTLDRVKRTKPANVRLIHVAEVRVEETSESLPVPAAVNGAPKDPSRTRLSRPVLGAMVKVVDAGGKPVRQARVTGKWVGLEADAISRPTLSNGVAYFPYPRDTWERPWPRFIVLNVMATGAAYDFEADAPEGSAWVSADGQIAIKPTPLRQRIAPEFVVPVKAEVANLGAEAMEVRVSFVPPNGEVRQGEPPRLLAPGQRETVTFRWYPEPSSPEGRYVGTVQALGEGTSVGRPVWLTFPLPRPLPARFGAMGGKDIAAGEDYEIKATVHNFDPSREIALSVACTIIEAHRHLARQEGKVGAGEASEFVWRPAEGEEPLRPGEYHARVTVLGVVGLSDVVGFAVRSN